MAGPKGFTKSENSKRYYRHRKIKEGKQVRICAETRTIFTPMDFEIEKDKHVKVLVKQFDYAMQTEAFFTPPQIILNSNETKFYTNNSFSSRRRNIST